MIPFINSGDNELYRREFQGLLVVTFVFLFMVSFMSETPLATDVFNTIKLDETIKTMLEHKLQITRQWSKFSKVKLKIF